MTNSIKPNAPLMHAYSHQGARGKHNDDRYDYFEIELGSDTESVRTVYVAVVADGVTSTTGGDQASEIAVTTIREVLCQHNRTDNLIQLLEQAIMAANLEIWTAAHAQVAHKNMSTTLVLAAMDGDTLYVLHLGDSRAYLVRNHEIYQLTLDHTWVQQAVDIGRFSAEVAKIHANRHVIQNFMGIHSSIEIDRSIIKPGTDADGNKRRFMHRDRLVLQENDMLLLCTDGLTDHVEDSQFLATMLHHRQQPRAATQSLIQLALEQNEPDNITALVIDFSSAKQQATHKVLSEIQYTPHAISGEQGEDKATAAKYESSTASINLATKKMLITVASILILLLLSGGIFAMLQSVSSHSTPTEAAVASSTTRKNLAVDAAESASTPTPVNVAIKNVVNTNVAAANPTKTASPVATPQATQTRAVAATATPIPTNTATATPTNTATPIPTSTLTPTATSTTIPTATSTKTPTSTTIPQLASTATPIPFETPQPVAEVSVGRIEPENNESSTVTLLTRTPTPMAIEIENEFNIPTELVSIWLEQDANGYVIQPRSELEETQRSLLLQGRCLELVISQRDLDSIILQNGLDATKLELLGKGKCDDPSEKPLRFSKNELLAGTNYISLWTMEEQTKKFLQPFSITVTKDIQDKPTAVPTAVPIAVPEVVLEVVPVVAPVVVPVVAPTVVPFSSGSGSNNKGGGQ